MKRIALIASLLAVGLPYVFATTWKTCGTGTWGSNAGNTDLRISSDNCTTPLNPYSVTFSNGDVLQFQSGQTITIASNIDLRSANLTIQFYGSTIFDNGKLVLNANSAIVLESGSTLTCTGGCGNNDQISVGSYNYTGNDLTTINNAPRPSTVDNTGSVLPIELLFFKAEPSDTRVTLRWATASEYKFDYFSIERSHEGVEFSEIAQVKGSGTSVVKKDYSFVDENPLEGRSYYRLKSVDFDLYTETFDVISVVTKAGKNVSIYPNPVTNGKLNINLNFKAGEDVTARITDLMGTEVGKFKMQSFSNTINLDLKPGTYVVRVFSDDFTSVSRFVVH